MSLSRSVSLGVLATLATVWAAVVVIGGLLLLFDLPAQLFNVPITRSYATIFCSICCIAAGNFVFMVLVADRVFPAASRGELTWTIEVFVIAVMFTTAIAFGVSI